MARYNKVTYEYTKQRKNFGKQLLFQNVPPHILDSIYPDKSEQTLYALRNPVHRDVQATLPQSEKDTNTNPLVTHEQGINHTEGGWPREVHTYNEEHIARHRRRVLHEDNYIQTVLNLAPVMKHYVDQNNAVDMYQTYFSDINVQEPVEKYTLRVDNTFRDTFRRPVSCIAWTNEKVSMLAVSYCDQTFVPGSITSKENKCYVWDITRQTKPAHEFLPDHPCWRLACSPKDPQVIVGGLENGIVSIFDIRSGEKAILSSSVYKSHRESITSLLFLNSRTQTEFFTGSPDGQCLWWDTRKLSEPINQLSISMKKISSGEKLSLSQCEGISCLNIDHNLPTRFLCGTDSGKVINVNRSGRNYSEIMTSYWDAHSGRIRAVQRSPCTTRMFLTCGDFTVRIWSDEIHTSPIIMTTPYLHQVTDASWAPLRYSCYMSTCAGGYFYYWDMLRKTKEPVATLKVSKYEITKLVPHRKGHTIAIGDTDGSINLINLSENMILPGKRDKQLMHQVYERETRREHSLDARVKEIHLKQAVEAAAQPATSDDTSDESDTLKVTEDEYFKIVRELQSETNILGLV